MLTTISLLLALKATTQMSSPKNMAFSSKLQSVAVFRDGYGYYVRHGKVKLEDGWATTNFVPNAIKGTVWIYALDGNDKVDTVISTQDNQVHFKSSEEIKDDLSDKIGLDFKITTQSGQEFDGRLNRLLNDMLLLQDGSAYNAIPYSQIRSIAFVGYPLKIHVDTSSPNKVENIGIAYLENGISWDPSYVLDLNGNTGTLTLRASMKNTTEALRNTQVQFVVGSPYISERGIQDFISMLPPAEATKATMAGTKAPQASQDNMVVDPDKATQASATPTVPHAAISGAEAGELFYYKKPDLSLAPNDIAMISLFNQSVKVTPQFNWNADGDQVNYLLQFVNNSQEPYTTGPVFVVDNNRPLGQDTLKYVAPGGKAEIKLSQGIGLDVQKIEKETHRAGPTNIGKATFIPVTLEGTLTVTNHRSSSASVTITRTVDGKVGKLSYGGEVTNTQILNGEPNPINMLKWKVEVPAGKSVSVTYGVVEYMTASTAGSPPVPAVPDGLPGGSSNSSNQDPNLG